MHGRLFVGDLSRNPSPGPVDPSKLPHMWSWYVVPQRPSPRDGGEGGGRRMLGGGATGPER